MAEALKVVSPAFSVADALFGNLWSTDRDKAQKAPLQLTGAIDDLIAKFRGDPKTLANVIRLGCIYATALACGVSLIPFTDNFASGFAGNMLTMFARPGWDMAVNGPLRDWLDNIFPTLEINVRLLVTGIENGALTDEEIVDTAVDAGYKDKEIKKLLKIAKMARFMKETKEDYAILDRYQDALISASIANARDEIDAAIKERQSLISEWKKLAEQQAMEAAAT